MKKEWFDKILESGKELKITITKKDVYDELFKICDREHSGCNHNCPVYALAIEEKEFVKDFSNNCPYFKNGKYMFERLKGKKLCELIINGRKYIKDFETVNKLMNCQLRK